jgi:hypothetical protein
MRKVTKHVWESDDGQAFDTKAEAEKHDARMALDKFFQPLGEDAEIDDYPLISTHILADLDRFAEIIRPLIRRPRAAKAEAQADDYEAQMGQAAEAEIKKKGKAT